MLIMFIPPPVWHIISSGEGSSMAQPYPEIEGVVATTNVMIIKLVSPNIWNRQQRQAGRHHRYFRFHALSEDRVKRTRPPIQVLAQLKGIKLRSGAEPNLRGARDREKIDPGGKTLSQANALSTRQVTINYTLHSFWVHHAVTVDSLCMDSHQPTLNLLSIVIKRKLP